MNKKIIYIVQELHAEHQASLQQIAPNYTFRNAEQPPTTEELPFVEVMLGWDPILGKEILALEQSPLKWIQANSAGVDYLDLRKLEEKGIFLSNMSGIHAIPIAESVLAMLLARFRGIQTAIQAQEKKVWLPHTDVPYDELAGKKMLVIGAGKIGQRLALVSEGLGMEVAGVNRSGRQFEHFSAVYKQSELFEHLPNFDIIVNILPLTKETKYFYNDAFFEKIKPGASFINVGRGPSVDTAALIRALESKKLGFAGLDVFEEEPLTPDSPLWTRPDVLITPHISGLVRHFQKNIMTIYSENLKSYVETASLARNQVDLTTGY
ncbi:phosphoglycerate dehydrogenase [Enterococcus sp. LJL98]